jgi:hypothetical protein
MKTLYERIGDPLSKGSVHVIRMSEPLADVTGAAGGSGVCAARTETSFE